jgi:hypothetical protein
MAEINPELPNPDLTAWNEGFTTSILIFIVVTAIFLLLTAGIFSLASMIEAAKNFEKYRCNPIMMPFAGQFGYDAKENFNFCVSNVLGEKVAASFAPLFGQMSQMLSVFTVIMNATLGMRKLFSNFFLSVNSFVGNVRNRIQNLLFQIRMSFIKMNSLMGRVFGTMFAVVFMGTSALTAANNAGNTDLVKFLAEFCFDPRTPIRMEDGSMRYIKDVRIGDRLAPLDGVVPIVSSTFRFDGRKTPMVCVDDVVLSEEHFVQYDGTWMPAKDHPRALHAESLPTLSCLNVTGNVFRIGNGGLIVRDYDEHDSPGIVEAVQRIAERALNGPGGQTKSVEDYSLGFDPLMEVQMTGGYWKPATDVRLGDRLSDGGIIVGIARERCGDCRAMPTGGIVSAAQLVYSGLRWMRAAQLYETEAGSRVLVQLITSNCGVITVKYGDCVYNLRDYREVALPEMETPYATGVVGTQVPV